MIVKEAEEQDILSLLEIGKRIHDFKPESELPFYSESLGFELYVLAKDDETNIGFVCVRFDDDTQAEIDYIAIDKKEEGKGYATMLLKEVMEELKHNGIKKIYLEVRSRNQRAISLYERSGFVQYRVRKHYYNDDDALCYVKEA